MSSFVDSAIPAALARPQERDCRLAMVQSEIARWAKVVERIGLEAN
jgi:hypothetical protein